MERTFLKRFVDVTVALLLRLCLVLTSVGVVFFAVRCVRAMPADEAEVLSKQSADEQVVRPIPEEEWNEKTRLWLARSVLGEAGWGRYDEQAAIAWVYATRFKNAKRRSFFQLFKRYSAAIRSPGLRRNPWMVNLVDGMMRPDGWPNGPLWKGRHDRSWMKTLGLIDRWYEGEVPNSCPGANHFGCYLDAPRADALGWFRVRCQVSTRNRFYDSRRKRPSRDWRQEPRWRKMLQ